MEPLLDTKAAAAFLRMPVSELLYRRQARQAPAYVKIRAAVRYRPEALRSFLAEHLAAKQLTPLPVPTRIEMPTKRSAVYVLVDGDDAPLYVGSTTDLYRRIAQHEHGARAVSVLVYFVGDDEQQMANLEEDLLLRLRPPLNKSMKAIGRHAVLGGWGKD